MPPEVLWQRQELENQVVSRLREAKKIYAEAVEELFTTWEQLIDDEIVEQLAKREWQEDLQILVVKAWIKKLPTKEKITKGTELK